MQTTATSKHLRQATEITLIAPVRRGFVPVAQPVTYAARLKNLFRVLFALRQQSLEANREVSFGALERLRMLRAFHWALFDDNTRLLLAVTFDGPWEPYIRAIVDDAAPLLDVIFCHCEGYDGHACSDGYAEFADWVRRHQISCDFLYANAPDVSIDDVRYLKWQSRLESLTRTGEDAPDLNLDLDGRTARELVSDEERLLGRSLLQDLGTLFSGKDRSYFDRTVEILLPPGNASARANDRAGEQPRISETDRRALRDELQGGILTGYENVTHGCLVLASLVDAREFERNLGLLGITSDEAARAFNRDPSPASCAVNLAFTWHGLKRIGLDADELAAFPPEFREGLPARAPMLGDIASNHPNAWQLPRLNWPAPERPVEPDADRVALASVDVIILIYGRPAPSGRAEIDDNDHVWWRGHPLYEQVAGLERLGLRNLHVQALRRYPERPPNAESRAFTSRTHFGFLDGLSQPDPFAPDGDRDQVALGDFVLGYPNASGTTLGWLPNSRASAHAALFKNGTFAVIRKLSQDVAAFDAFIAANERPGLTQTDIRNATLGRKWDGEPLVPRGAHQNDFDFASDPRGALCPLHAHVRRGNPRLPGTPRLLRRGFAYGSRYAERPQDVERGIVFTAYNASIADQFELLRRWMSGGNKTGILSSQFDLLTGVPEDSLAFAGDGRAAACPAAVTPAAVQHGATHPITVGERTFYLRAPLRPLVELRWGTYAFVPSLPALEVLARRAAHAQAHRSAPRETAVEASELTDRGGEWLARLEGKSCLEWKRVLEDPELALDARAVWAAVRGRGGLLHSEYGALIAGAASVERVLSTPSAFSVRGYYPRMLECLGALHLGMDPRVTPIAEQTGAESDALYEAQVRSGDYASMAHAINGKIVEIGARDCFAEAFAHARDFLEHAPLLQTSRGKVLDLNDFAQQVIGALSHDWFGLPAAPGQDYRAIIQGFLLVSQYVFLPHPEEPLALAARESGKRIQQAFRNLDANRGLGAFQAGDVADPALAAMGAVLGFVGPTYGSFSSVMTEWLEDEQLWRVQREFLDGGADERARVLLRKSVLDAMMRRPVPAVLHRSAVAASCPELGRRAEFRLGERVVVDLSSAVAERADENLLFGGEYGSAAVHACPGKEVAIGTLLGMIGAILSRTELRRISTYKLSYR